MYFPLPANDAQQEIVRRLRRQRGVLVQGPPGTGKSHTIVNLVSHLLATDQRVLVTSHTARALKVLRDKFPPELASLCVTHLRGEEGARAMLERSVGEILNRSAARQPWQEDEDERRLFSTLERARQDEHRLLDTLRQIRQAETDALDVFGYRGSAQRIGGQLRDQEAGVRLARRSERRRAGRAPERRRGAAAADPGPHPVRGAGAGSGAAPA